ncbi:type VII toxin-antitoxin system HepT family RNase toxin [Roseofilum casamattae]|uniref:DUF86 domain-containing protein n=1 Tax=Roseofilum casamattae BLCC-M143 TaxID=3022442 RepID=A0ABT7BS77_9CYAN|nr:HepT-like ribonuclease domain-containing protein [Roseofilum casamattae]MDJ1182040.1 DUF86 domain-containing protein [Roseofilum casamattae BLCC-M143]
MTTVDPNIVLRKLGFLDNYLNELQFFRAILLNDYLADRNSQLVVERLLQLSFQVAIDVNRYLLKTLNIPQPETNFDAFLEMSRCGILTPELAKILAPSGSLRNRLVHLYDEIDPVKVHECIQLALQEYPKYQRQILQYLDTLEDEND